MRGVGVDAPTSTTSSTIEGGIGPVERPQTPTTPVVLPPGFNPVIEFFAQLARNYQGVRTEKLRSLQEFQRKAGESLREAFTRMRRLISVTQGVTEAQAVQFWYGILAKDVRRRVRDATLLQTTSPTLATVFALSERIELNIVEEQVVTVGFSREASHTSSSSSTRPQVGVSQHRDKSAQP